MLTKADLELVDNIVLVLKPFYDATLELSYDDACISLVITLVKLLNAKLQSTTQHADGLSQLKAATALQPHPQAATAPLQWHHWFHVTRLPLQAHPQAATAPLPWHHRLHVTWLPLQPHPQAATVTSTTSMAPPVARDPATTPTTSRGSSGTTSMAPPVSAVVGTPTRSVSVTSPAVPARVTTADIMTVLACLEQKVDLVMQEATRPTADNVAIRHDLVVRT